MYKFLNYSHIVQHVSLLKNKALDLLSIPLTNEAQEELRKINTDLTYYSNIRKNVNVIVNFLERNIGVRTYSLDSVASINLNRNSGHSSAVSKFLLRNPSLRVIVITHDRSQFLQKNQNVENVTILSDRSGRALRGRSADMLILDGLTNAQVLSISSNISLSETPTVVRVGVSL